MISHAMGFLRRHRISIAAMLPEPFDDAEEIGPRLLVHADMGSAHVG